MTHATKTSNAILFAAFAWMALAIGHAQAQRQLVIYCGVDEKWCRAVTNEYQKQTGVQVDMTRMSAGEVYARVRAEGIIRTATYGLAERAIRICRQPTRR